MALEATLAKEHAAYNDEIRQMGVDSLEAYRVLLAQLRNVGTLIPCVLPHSFKTSSSRP
jgi:hypothetical protein